MSDKKGVSRHMVANMNCDWSKQYIILKASHVIRESEANYWSYVKLMTLCYVYVVVQSSKIGPIH